MTKIDKLSAFCLDVQSGGPNWVVPLGRRDSRGASLSGSNNDIPAPNNTFQTILTKFQRQGLDIVDLVALSGTWSLLLHSWAFIFAFQLPSL